MTEECDLGLVHVNCGGPPELTVTIMSPDPILELSVEQLIKALNKKLFTECARIQSTVPPASRALVATLAAEVRSNEP